MTARTITISKPSGGYVLTATLPENATRWDVAAATVELSRLDPFLAETATTCCGTAYGTVHVLGCPQAPANLLEALRAEAGLS